MNFQYFLNQLLTPDEAGYAIFWLTNSSGAGWLLFINCIISQSIDNALYLTLIDVIYSQTGDGPRNTYLISQAPAVGVPINEAIATSI